MIFYSKKQKGNCLGNSPFLILFFLLMNLSACVTMGDAKQEESLKTAVEDLRLSSANTLQAIEEIKTENEKLKGEIEKLNFLIKQNEEASSVRFLAIESKLSSSSTPLTAKAEAVKEPQDILSADIDKRYKAAREFHEAKKFDEAEKYYSSIIGSPSKWYEERALYYMGVLNYDKKEYEKAVLSLQDFVDKYPKSKNIPSALYFQGESLSGLGKAEEAKLFFDDLISKFPKSKEAKDAKKRLSK